MAATVVGEPPAASAQNTGFPIVEIRGGGWGHGRGMGQYGALGYARDFGWNSRRILDHFYRGTTQGPVPAITINPDRLRVQLAHVNGRVPVLTLAEGRMMVFNTDGIRQATVTRNAMRLIPVSGGYDLQVGDGCGGPWDPVKRINTSTLGVLVEPDPDDPGDDGLTIGSDSRTLLGVCGPSYRAWYDGEIWAHQTTGGMRTVNVVTIEQYLRGVVPNEVPASWPAAALEAQAVAARSYALAGDGRWGGHADTCDNTFCQVYDGRFTSRGGSRSATHPRTDAAIAATAGQVRLTANGRVARTEFSSSTGGHTAGGVFPAVVDEGDAVSANPNASWVVTVGLAALESRYGLGSIESLTVTKRDGHGRFGGRAQEVTMRFRNGTRTMSGVSFRRFFGLKSELFAFGEIQFSAAPDHSAHEPTVRNLYQRLAGRAPTGDELALWLPRIGADEAAGRNALARALVNGDHFAGALVDDLYRTTFGRSADAKGRSYWIRRLTTGGSDRLSYEQVGRWFFGSSEYFRRSGGTDRAFVERLYRDLLQRPADQSGLNYWLGVKQRGSGEEVATWFYRSVESRRKRAANLYRVVTGEPANAAQIEDGAKRLLTESDLDLAARWAATAG